MKQALYILILPLLLASCVLVPDEWYDDSRSAQEISRPVRSYSILPPPPETVFDGSETVYRTNYTLNETRVAKVGEPVLRVQAFKKDNFITHQLILEKPVTVTIEKEEMRLPAKRYPVFGTFEWGAETFYVLPKYKQYYFLVNMKGELQPMYLYEIKNSDKGYGYNFATNEYSDMLSAGIVDPAKVTRSALQNAASVAAMVLTTESLVTDIKDPQADAAQAAAMAAAAQGGGMY